MDASAPSVVMDASTPSVAIDTSAPSITLDTSVPSMDLITADASATAMDTSLSVEERIDKAERFFKKACDQIVVINRQLDDLGIRYDRANQAGRRSFRYSLRLRIAVAEGVRNMYYEYATQKADEISELRRTQILQLRDFYAERAAFADENSDSVVDSDSDDNIDDDNIDDDDDNDDVTEENAGNDDVAMMIDV